MNDDRKTILVVDDAKFMRDTLTQRLPEQCDVITAEDGAEGVALYKEKNPDAVLMDINMPKMHGIDALKEIIAYDPKARVIMLSVEDSNEIIEDCKAFGAMDYIIKPFGMDTILQSLHVALFGE